MSLEERQVRSELAQLIHGEGLMRGTLQVRRRKCGRSTCRCAKGEGHESLYVAFREEGRMRQLFIPKDWEPQVRQWVANHQRARQLMEEVSRIYHDKVRQRRP